MVAQGVRIDRERIKNMLCVLDDIEFPIREYDIKGTQI